MSALRTRMIDDMNLAGLAKGTQQMYVSAVRRLAAQYRRAPDQLTEEEMRSYLLQLRQRGAARGTFKTSQYGLRFFFHHTLGHRPTGRAQLPRALRLSRRPHQRPHRRSRPPHRQLSLQAP